MLHEALCCKTSFLFVCLFLSCFVLESHSCKPLNNQRYHIPMMINNLSNCLLGCVLGSLCFVLFVLAVLRIECSASAMPDSPLPLSSPASPHLVCCHVLDTILSTIKYSTTFLTNDKVRFPKPSETYCSQKNIDAEKATILICCSQRNPSPQRT
jgi:hypothetical protein